MTVRELYDFLDRAIPKSLSEEWDNDGMMCSPDSSEEVKRVLLTLDVTEEIVDYAIERSYVHLTRLNPVLTK